MKMVKSPGSPSRSIISNQTDSVLTESTDDEESNFIALLQYKDAFHLLGLKEETSPNPAEIRAAYMTCRDQTIAALERCEANQRQQQPARGSFLISQTNYLELKLNALDQAIDELLPEDGDRNADGTRQSDQQIQQRDVSSLPHHKETVEQQARKKQLDLPSGRPQTWPKEQTQTPEPRNSNSGSLAKADDDDLDTIDIYFNSSKNTEPKASDQSDTISIITWDATSIFSMISNSKTNEDTASESGLSEVLLGSVKKGRGTVTAPKSMLSRPPRSINRAITSPRSITDFSPSILDRGHYKEVGHPVHKKVVTAGGRLNRAGPQSTSDAVRKGVMRALDEDDSECVSLDFEDRSPQVATKQRTIEKGNRNHEKIRTTSNNRKSNGVSKRGGPQQNRGLDEISDDDQVSSASSKDDYVDGRCNRRRTKNQAEPKQEEDFYDSLVQSGMDGYNAVLESSMELSNHLCDALQACWVDDSNADEGSAADDLTGVFTDGESTAFNTLSSFSKCGSSKLEDLNKRRLV